MRDSLTVGTSLMALLTSEVYLKLLVMTGALIPIFLIYLSTIPRDINHIVEASKAILDIQGWHNIIGIQCYWKYYYSIVVIMRCCVSYDIKLTHVPYSGKVWQFAKLKSSVVTINNPLADLIIRQTFFCQKYIRQTFFL